MNTTETSINRDISHSDNSHIFGMPIQISEGYDGHLAMPLNFHDEKHLEHLREWIEKVHFLEVAGIEMQLHYGEPLIKEKQ